MQHWILVFAQIRSFWPKYLAELLILSVLIYFLLLMVRGTRAMQVLKGLAAGLIFFVAATLLQFTTLIYFFRLILPGLIVGIVLIFQPEIRRGLAGIGQRRFFNVLLSGTGSNLVAEVVKAVNQMAQKRIGGLIVIEQDASLRRLISQGVQIDAEVEASLLVTIFTPHTPLHDGAVIISEGRIAAASVILPLSENPELAPELGTRHRAALGLSEEMDSISVAVSEERGTISLARHGELQHDLDIPTLRSKLNKMLGIEKEEPKPETAEA